MVRSGSSHAAKRKTGDVKLSEALTTDVSIRLICKSCGARQPAYVNDMLDRHGPDTELDVAFLEARGNLNLFHHLLFPFDFSPSSTSRRMASPRCSSSTPAVPYGLVRKNTSRPQTPVIAVFRCV